jgi:hypothetical protein
MTSLTSGKDNLYNFSENCFINKLSSYSQANCSAAFSLRLLKANYTGPMVNVRRGSDNATLDFYGNIYGNLGTSPGGKGQGLTDWLGGATGFLVTWYDQSGYSGRDLTQATTITQPVITATSITYDGTKFLSNTTNTPLTSSLKTYTYVCNFTATDYSTSRTIFEIAPSTGANYARACLMQFNSSYGFSGLNSDAFFVNNNTTTNRKCVMMCNHNLSTGNIVINDNATVYSATTNNVATSNLSVNPQTFYVGRNPAGAEFFIGNINEIIIFQNTLTLRESEMYYVPNTVSRKNYTSFPRIQLKGVPKEISIPVPPAPRMMFDSQCLSNLTSGNTVSAWSSYNRDTNYDAGYTITATNSPIYRNVSGTTTNAIIQAPYIEFTRASSMSINGGARVFNIATNGGFTAVVYCAFTGTAGSYERIFDFTTSTVDNTINNDINLTRNASNNYVSCNAANGSTWLTGPNTFNSASGTIVQGTWYVWCIRYTHSSKFFEIIQNGITLNSGTLSAQLTDRTFNRTFMGRSEYTASDSYSSINIAGAFFYDRFLTDSQLSAVSNHLVYPTTYSIPNVIPDYTKVFKVGNVQTIGYRQDQCMYFNGSVTTYIDIQDLPALPMTFCYWFNSSDVTTIYSPVCLCDLSRNGFGIQNDILSGNFTVYAALPTQWSNTTAVAVTVNTWYHIAIVVSMSNQVLVYINGSLNQTLTSASGTSTPGIGIPPARSRLIVGGAGDGFRGFKGMIYDLRVYDYTLRADEVTNIYDSREKLQLTYTTPSNYLVNVRNWYNNMKLVQNSGYTGYTAVTAGSDPNVQYQLTSTSNGNGSNIFYNQTPIQNYASFTCSFEINVASATADAMFFYCGSTSTSFNNGSGTSSSYGVNFQVYGSVIASGVYINNNSGTALAYSGDTHWLGLGMWVPITITYTRGVTNTWVINLSGTDIITYSDPNNATWLASAGNYWGVGAWNGGASMNSYIRRVELTYVPYTNTLTNSLNSSLKTYPTGAMTATTTVLTDGTYIASASNTGGGSPSLYTVFDYTFSNTSNVWWPGAVYNITTGVYTSSVSTTVSGTTQLGEWIQIQMPTAIVINSYGLSFYFNSNNFAAKSFVLAGSNDASTWTSLSDYESKKDWVYGYEQVLPVQNESRTAYRYYRLILRSSGGVYNGSGNQDQIVIDSLRLFTNQNTNKYPIAALAGNSTIILGNTLGNGQYVCSASTENSSTYFAFRAFMNSYNDNVGWASAFSLYSATTGAYTGSVSTTVSGTSYSGEWLQIQLPNAIQLASFNILPRQDGGNYLDTPATFVLAGSNDGVIWTLVHTGTTTSSTTEKSFTCNAGNNNKYNYFRIVCQTIGVSGNTWSGFQNMSLFAGHSARTSNGLNMYPPASLTANTTTLSGYSYGNGAYVCSASEISANSAFNGFDGANGTPFQVAVYNVTTGVYSGSTTTTVSGVTQTGAWLQIQLPNKIQLYSCSVTSSYNTFPYTPRSFVIAGSNDGSTWTSLYDTTNCSSWISGIAVQNIQVNASVKYMYYRFINRRNGVADSQNGQDWWFMDNCILYDSSSITPRGLIDGLTWKSYNGYHADSMTFTTTNTYMNVGTSIDFTDLQSETNGLYYNGVGQDLFTLEWFGYFRANVTGTWTFTILQSDDSSYIWVGSAALSGYTTTNQVAKQSSTTGTVNMIAGVYYPIRILYGENTGGEVFSFTFTPPGGVPTRNGQGYFFSSTGMNSVYPAESAKIIKDLTGTNTDGTYYINVNGTSTATYCLMNDCYDGGGWMMLMKATTGSTFNYASTHWTTTSTLNPTDTTRNNADAKYNVFNYNYIKDVMAIWPDINPDSFTNVYGKNGGSIYVKDGWVWKVDNWNSTTRTTALAGFQSNRFASNNSDTGNVQQPISNSPFKYNGFSTGVFSSQTGSYLHFFYSIGCASGATSISANIRWGMLFNNDTNNLTTLDAFCGIGIGGSSVGNYSAGDYNDGLGGVGLVSGINRSARVELYGR